MRSVVSFVIGSILGATAILLYLQNTQQLAIASEHRNGTQASASADVELRPVRPTDLLIPVIGVTPADLRDDFKQPRGGGRTHGALDIRAPRGTPVVATADGTIRKLFTSRAGGITIYQTDPEEDRKSVV